VSADHLNQLWREARRIADLGFKVVLCAVRSKRPLTTHGVHDASADPATIDSWCSRWPDANLAIALGPLHVVADIDNEPALIEALETRGLDMPTVFPATATVATPRGTHFHYTVAASSGLHNAVAALPGLDVKTAGGYALIPPSVGADGTPYTWVRQLEEIAPAGDRFLALLRASGGPRQRAPAWDTFVYKRYGVGERNAKLTSLTGYLLAKRIDPIVVLQLVRSFNTTNCVPPLDDSEVVRIWQSISRLHTRR
jgi:hypothetical protein